MPKSISNILGLVLVRMPLPYSSSSWRHSITRPRVLHLQVRRTAPRFRATADNASNFPLPIPNHPGGSTADASSGVSRRSGADAVSPLRMRHRSIVHGLGTLWRFSRPHTIWGTLIAVICMHTLAWLSGGWINASNAVMNLGISLVPALFLNVFIVGLNQYFDVPIDEINKPHLPLAAGTLSFHAARRIILLTLLSGLSFCFAPGANLALRVVLVGSVLLGVAYSAPPVRLKRYPLLASACILSVRGMLVNAGFFMHAMQTVSLAVLTPLVRFAIGFFVAFGIVIALLKDVPDIRGDRVYGIRTLSVRLGPTAIFRLCVTLLCVMFVVAAVFFGICGNTRFAPVAAIVHVAVAAGLAWRARNVDPCNGQEVYAYYMLTWRAFYLEYFLLPFGV